MRRSQLKYVRVILALTFFMLTLLVFAGDLLALTGNLSRTILCLQFLPSLLTFMQVAAFTSAGFILVAVITLLFGRIYCSTVCPLGFIMDLAIDLRNRIKRYLNQPLVKSPVLQFHGEHHRIGPGRGKARTLLINDLFRYAILIATVVCMLMNSLLLINLLDPFSLAGKIMATLFRPFFLMGHNLVLLIGVSGDSAPQGVHVSAGTTGAVIFASVLFTVIVMLALFKDRWYCNVVCPVGTVLALLSKVSIYKLTISGISCSRCAKCLQVCKGRCIDPDDYAIEYDRCVGCFNCLNVCRDGAIGYQSWPAGRRARDRSKQSPDDRHISPTNSSLPTDQNLPGFYPLKKESGTALNPSRRRFFEICGVGISVIVLPESIVSGRMVNDRQVSAGTRLIAGAGNVSASAVEPGNAGGKQFIPNPDPGTEVLYTGPVTPPGSGSREHYSGYCTSCHLCVSRCPTRVLQPAFFEFGLSGILQPKLDFHKGCCLKGCTLCSEICPAGAILPLKAIDRDQVKIGSARLAKNQCIVAAQRRKCGLCAAKCPSKAIRLVPYLGDLLLPAIDDRKCTGCGACEFVCPVRPDRAIMVEALEVHRKMEQVSSLKPAGL